ncbi:MAG: formylglycine-generating enzyme family protein [Rhodobacteraceae bacterium]|nr:formylglycine-generating enzyme family protein [Paracoccaceae bacterium]
MRHLIMASTLALVATVGMAGAQGTGQIDRSGVDRAAWEFAQELNTADAFQAYLEAFPEGQFRSEAEAQLFALRPDLKPAPQPEPEPEPPRTSLVLVNPPQETCLVCPRMVRVPGGGTMLGSDQGGAEGPRINQTIAAFEISATEITVADMRAFEAATGTRTGRSCFIWTAEGRLRSRDGAYWGAPGFDVTDDHPAACVSWDDALAYIDWLNDADPRGGWRLPSEAEFEYAARGMLDVDYPWPGGLTAICQRVNGAGAESRFRHRNTACDDGTEAPVPAGVFPVNPYGLSHMIGNLWEWTADCWNGSHRGAAADGAVRTTGTCDSRVLRGGSWDDPPENLRVSYRVGIPKTRRQANVGFRVARDLAPGG